MLLVLGDVPGIIATDLMARVSKITGRPGVRGPLIDACGSTVGLPLSQLKDGDKLHILGPSDGRELAGRGPRRLGELLTSLGWPPSVRLKQIHLIAPSTGRNGANSFAAQFEAAIRGRGLEVDEIKAPIGPVRCDSDGKVWVYSERFQGWIPSSPALNYYVGPRVPEKHRQTDGT
jgi:hypothetical protein